MRTLERDPADRFSSAADLRAALLTAPVPATTGPSVPHEDTGELPAPPATFTRAERNWLYPALFLVLVALALTTIGLLWNQGGNHDGQDPAPTVPATATPAPVPVQVRTATAFDPEGDGHENDASTRNVLDDQESTAWRTEGYEPPGFSGGKTGVGLSLELDSRSTLDQITIKGSANDWSGLVFVTDSDTPEDIDRRAEHAAAVIEDFSGSISLDLSGGRDARTGSSVLIWITDLGSPAQDGRHRVEINTVELFGRSVD